MIAVDEKTLAEVKINNSYTIKSINTKDDELNHFLFTLGCYAGELITLVSSVSDTLVVAIKDARYSINKEFAQAIVVE